MNKIISLIFVLNFFVAPLVSAEEQMSSYARTTADGNAAVASVNKYATQIGVDILDRGGNAVDAAVAIAFALGIVDSHNSGIGGGCFIVAHLQDGSIIAIDGREMAPKAAHRDMYVRDGEVDKSLSRHGALAIGIPGSVAALEYLLKRGGSFNLKEVVSPSIPLAEKGFAVDAVMAKRLAATVEHITKFPATAKLFLTKQGTAKKEGDLLVQKDLANTYRQLAQHGSNYFYKGEFAKAVDKWMKKNGGVITQSDFANYQMVLRTPVVTTFKGHSIIGFPPPSSGGALVGEILNILENFDLKKMTEAERQHVVIEAMRLGFADRAHWFGDPDFVRVPKGLISKEYATSLAKKIDLEKVNNVEKYSIPSDAETHVFGKHTTHISAADKKGNWIAITTTLNTSFGSKVTIPGTGVLMNNQMDDFTAQPGAKNFFGLVSSNANAIEGRKRPLSSMSPTIVLKNGKPVLTVGAAGGPTIISQVLQVILEKIALEKNLEQAMASVRVHQQWRPSATFIDPFADQSLWDELIKKGHELKKWPPFGATQAIALDEGKLVPITEPRLVAGQR